MIKQYYQPTDRGLEKKISEKLAYLRSLDSKAKRNFVMNWIAVAVGGALGAMARYAISTWIFQVSSHKFPYATLTVNVLGSFVMGILFVVIIERSALPVEMRSLWMIGFLGAFTTFSTFSLDALGLWQNGHLFMALLYVLATVVLCLLAISSSIWLTRLL